MLTQQLRELEKDGLVIREQFNEIPPRVEYSLSEIGLSPKSIFLSIEQWGQLHSAANRAYSFKIVSLLLCKIPETPYMVQNISGSVEFWRVSGCYA